MKRRLLLFILISFACKTGFTQCAGPVTYTVTPQPSADGTYYPGQVVTFCITENSYNQNISNWFHGLTLSLGPAWDLSTLTVVSLPPAVSGSGSWNYYPNGETSYTTGQHYGPGFYFGTDAGAVNGSFAADGDDPGKNYGDDCSGTCSWTFCFSIQIYPNASIGELANITALPSGDGQSGSWTQGAGGCNGDTATAPVPVTTSVGFPILLVQLTPQNVTCSGLCNGSITAQGSNGYTPYKYTWSTGATTTVISALCPGNYICTVTDSLDSTAVASYVITQPQPLSITDSIVNPVCDSMCNGAVITNVSGGTQPYSYLWSTNPVQTASVAYALCAGQTNLTVTDSNNCVLSRFYILVNPPPLSLQLVSETNVFCYGENTGVVQVSASGGNPGAYTYVWSNSDTGSWADSLTAGHYFVTATDVLGCTVDSEYIVTQPATRMVITPVTTSPSCNNSTNGAISVTVTGGMPPLTYQWIDSSNNASLMGPDISPVTPGAYWLTVTDASGCELTDSIWLNPPPPIIIDSVPVIDPLCYGDANGKATVYCHGGTQNYSYQWAGYPQDTFFRIQGLTAGTTGVTVTDANQCTASATVVVNQPDSLTIALVNSHGAVCAGQNNGGITVDAAGGTGAYSYVWDDGVTGPSDTALGVSSVSVTVTDANSCTAAETFSIFQPQQLAGLPIVQNALCFQAADGSINANPSGGTPPYTFMWSDSQPTQIAYALALGYYTCTISDANGCSVSFGDSINQPPLLVDTAYGTPVKCAGQENGTISIIASGGTPPYDYSATQDGVNFYSTTNGIIMNLDTGTYEVIIEDSLGCDDKKFAYVANATPDNFLMSVDSTTCYGPSYNDGAVLVTYTSVQNAPYQFNIDNGTEQDTGYFQNLAAGLHSVIATNVNGCNDTLPVLIPEPLPIVVIITPDSLELPLGQSAGVVVSYLNATNPSYGWTGDITGLSCVDCPNPVVSPYTSTTYTVAVSMVSYSSTCYGYGTLYVNVSNPEPFFIPNAFSPNGDGQNDLFTVYGNGIASVELNIFNRWGELVYATGNSLAGWDGTYKGEMQPVGVYAYVATITFLDNTKITRTGSVALMR